MNTRTTLPAWLSPLLLALLATGLAACGGDRPAADTTGAAQPAESAAFLADQRQWREQRRAGLLEPQGWTSLIGLHWIDPGAHYLGSAADNGIRLAMGPAQLGMLTLEDDALRFVPAPGAALTLDGLPLGGRARLLSDADPQGPSHLGFDEGRGVAMVIKRGPRYALRVKHADAPTRTGFHGLDYWPADPAWVVDGRFVAHPADRTIPIASIIGTTDEVPNPGAIEFTRDGRTYRIEALDEGGDELFLVFADRTNGHGSYPAGRFLYVDKPGPDGRVRVDFNRAYNPPCAFTPFATCPLPPPENRLDLAVTAGEKAYAHP